MLAGAARPFENFMTCVPDCYDEKLPWSFRAKNFQVFEMGMDNNNDDPASIQSNLDQMDKVRSTRTDMHVAQKFSWKYRDR